MPFRLWQPLLAWPILLFHRPVWATPAIAPPTTAPPLNTSPQPIVETPLKPVQCQVGATTSAITGSPGALQTTSPNGVSQPCPPTFTLHRAISPLPLPIAGDEIESLPIRQITSPGSSKTTLVNFLTPYQVATPSALTEIQRVPVPTNVYAQTPSPSPSAPPPPHPRPPPPPPPPPYPPGNRRTSPSLPSAKFPALS